MKIGKKYLMATALLLTIAAALVIYTYNPEENGFFPKCIFYSLTGLKCPGCGSQRAIHHLLHGNIRQAFIQNPLLLAAIPYILSYFILYPLSNKRAERIRTTLYHGPAVHIILGLIIIFWIIRNLFGF